MKAAIIKIEIDNSNKFISYISDEDYEQVLLAQETVQNFIDYYYLSRFMSDGATEFITSVMQGVAEYRDKYGTNTFNLFAFRNKCNRHFNNVLSNLNSFLEINEKNLKKQFGRDSLEHKDFQKVIENLKLFFEFRFLIWLRNVSQHQNLTIDNFDFDCADGKTVTLLVSFDKQNLLNLNGTRTLDLVIKKDLISQPDKIPVIPLLEKFLFEIDLFTSKISSPYYAKATNSFQLIATVLKKYNCGGGNFILVHKLKHDINGKLTNCIKIQIGNNDFNQIVEIMNNLLISKIKK